MSRSTKWILGLFVLFLVMISTTIINSYNNIVRLDESVSTQHSNISVQLERRADLIPNLITTVEAYASHEIDIFENLAKSRENLLKANTITEQAEADLQMTSALGRLFAISETYPDLKANTNFIRLQDELASTENSIAVAKPDYNSAIQKYNSAIRTFPTVIIANFIGFKQAEYFESGKTAQTVSIIKFDF